MSNSAAHHTLLRTLDSLHDSCLNHDGITNEGAGEDRYGITGFQPVGFVASGSNGNDPAIIHGFNGPNLADLDPLVDAGSAVHDDSTTASHPYSRLPYVLYQNNIKKYDTSQGPTSTSQSSHHSRRMTTSSSLKKNGDRIFGTPPLPPASSTTRKDSPRSLTVQIPTNNQPTIHSASSATTPNRPLSTVTSSQSLQGFLTASSKPSSQIAMMFSMTLSGSIQSPSGSPFGLMTAGLNSLSCVDGLCRLGGAGGGGGGGMARGSDKGTEREDDGGNGDGKDRGEERDKDRVKRKGDAKSKELNSENSVAVSFEPLLQRTQQQNPKSPSKEEHPFFLQSDAPPARERSETIWGVEGNTLSPFVAAQHPHNQPHLQLPHQHQIQLHYGHDFLDHDLDVDPDLDPDRGQYLDQQHDLQRGINSIHLGALQPRR
eukprot:CAMPEP_0175040918 /NCGR_PEP_ID=MMETSP0052_2-20121109/1579_1 /TAXON_ID=51329 ORGANISM="Polytomella parva, Strain SAG 63-3" /NCGR_SAMPLE_ID=MMETSP0052_2 /ASSEMBLY_ACC=CAM_ASM_000194 /LENGTH=428 /DNA_ID=CAMNT_0016303281 /DNA_START=22 /DNA_END=1308 /DNA_ORIENTATION=-